MNDACYRAATMEPQATKQSKGGQARAMKLSAEEKSESASRAAKARWGKLAKATHTGELAIGAITIPCAVLQNGQRVLSQGGLLTALGRSRQVKGGQGATSDGGDKVPAVIAAENLKPFIPDDLTVTTTPVEYVMPHGGRAFGYAAELLPIICEVYLSARQANALRESQALVAERAEILVRGLARVGIVALIDEATGFQYDRQREALQDLLKEFISNELRRWVKTFPPSYFREMCRLRGETYRPDLQLPRYFGHLTNNIIYKRLAPGVLDALQQKNPKEGARRKSRHHQWLSENVGHPKLLQHVGLAVGLMKVSPDWDAFVSHMDRAAPVWDGRTLFDHLDD